MSSEKLALAAIIYDFDGTLAPGSIQEHSFLPSLSIDKRVFWPAVKAEAKLQDADEILVYMRQMLERAREQGIPVTKESLKQHGKGLPLFNGVPTWFEKINGFARQVNLQLEHYVISSGIREMIEGCEIGQRFTRIFASSFIYDADGQAVWPGVAINYTTKTQFLFRINKGIPNTWNNEAINTYVPMDKRTVPFQNMLFIGDGDTDIPSMKMVRHQGGYSIGVFDPDIWQDRQEHIQRLISADRVNFVASADYREGSQLDVTVRGLLGRIAENVRLSET